MTDPRQPKPTQAQKRLLRQLAIERGESFAIPKTKAEASAEIRRLKSRRPSTRSDVRRERAEVSRDMATGRGDGAAIRPHELSCYGSSAAWSSEPLPLLRIAHSAAHGTSVDGTTAGDGAGEVLRSYGLRWSRELGRWQLPRSAGRSANRRLVDALAAALRVYSFEVELSVDD